MFLKNFSFSLTEPVRSAAKPRSARVSVSSPNCHTSAYLHIDTLAPSVMPATDKGFDAPIADMVASDTLVHRPIEGMAIADMVASDARENPFTALQMRRAGVRR